MRIVYLVMRSRDSGSGADGNGDDAVRDDDSENYTGRLSFFVVTCM